MMKAQQQMTKSRWRLSAPHGILLPVMARQPNGHYRRILSLPYHSRLTRLQVPVWHCAALRLSLQISGWLA